MGKVGKPHSESATEELSTGALDLRKPECHCTAKPSLKMADSIRFHEGYLNLNGQNENIRSVAHQKEWLLVSGQSIPHNLKFDYLTTVIPIHQHDGLCSGLSGLASPP